MMEGLKEWATVVKALEQGKQTVILRKGGILETASGFNVESTKVSAFIKEDTPMIVCVKKDIVPIITSLG